MTSISFPEAAFPLVSTKDARSPWHFDPADRKMRAGSGDEIEVTFVLYDLSWVQQLGTIPAGMLFLPFFPIALNVATLSPSLPEGDRDHRVTKYLRV